MELTLEKQKVKIIPALVCPGETISPIEPQTKHALKDCLTEQGLFWKKWHPKTADHLWNELVKKECSLGYLTKDGMPERTIVRFANLSIVDVWHNTGTQKLRLVEEEQLFAHGEVLTLNMFGVREKGIVGEPSLTTALRGVSEELAIPRGEIILQRVAGKPLFEEAPSKSYRGIITRKEITTFFYDMPAKHYRAGGYKEEQKDKTVVFHWRVI